MTTPMKVILAAVTSTNGKLTRGDDPDIYKWTSKEDQEQFFKLLEQAGLIVMGSSTYESAKDMIRKSLKPQISQITPKTLRIILTSNPEKYKDEEIPGQLEFKNETPLQLINQLTEYNEML